MVKRASNQTPASQAKAAKTASPFQPELALLKQAELPASCRQMLVAMLPHCLGTAEAQRHGAQQAVAKTLDEIFAGLERAESSAVLAAQEALRGGEAELAPLAARVEAAQAEFDAKAAEAAAAEKAQESGPETEAVAGAKKALEAAKAHQGGLAGERDLAEQRRSELREKLEASWGPLKEGALAPASKMQKELRAISEVFKKCGAEESFLVALPVALRADVRKGEVASALGPKVLQYGDELLQRQIQDCTDLVDGFEGKTAEAALSVTSAEATLAKAVAAHDVVLNVYLEASGRLASAQERLSEATDASEAAQQRTSEAAAELDAAEGRVKATKELIAARGQEEAAEAADAE